MFRAAVRLCRRAIACIRASRRAPGRPCRPANRCRVSPCRPVMALRPVMAFRLVMAFRRAVRVCTEARCRAGKPAGPDQPCPRVAAQSRPHPASSRTRPTPARQVAVRQPGLADPRGLPATPIQTAPVPERPADPERLADPEYPADPGDPGHLAHADFPDRPGPQASRAHQDRRDTRLRQAARRPPKPLRRSTEVTPTSSAARRTPAARGRPTRCRRLPRPGRRIPAARPVTPLMTSSSTGTPVPSPAIRPPRRRARRQSRARRQMSATPLTGTTYRGKTAPPQKPVRR